MMQSILSTTNKTPTSVANSDISATEKPISADGKEGLEKDALRFSDVLDSLIEGSEQVVDKNVVDEALMETSSEEGNNEEKVEEVDEIKLQTPLSGEDLVTENENNSLVVNVPLLTEPTNKTINETSEKLVSEDIEFDVLADSKEPAKENDLSASEKKAINDDLLNNALLNKDVTDKDNKSDSVTGKIQAGETSSEQDDLPVQEKVVNPILAQIEAAQKTDTQIKEVKPQVSTQETGVIGAELKKSEKELVKNAKTTDDKSYEKGGKLTFENALADEPDKQGKELLTKDNLLNAEKLDNLLPAFKSELAKPVLNHNVEGNVFNTLSPSVSSAERALTSATIATQNPLLQSAALQQPIELQEKHASAMIGERMLMMIKQGKQEVTIRLDPAELGSMHIKLQVQQDQVQVAIQTQVSQSRDIIEQNLPRLREQLAQQGINLGEASVEQQSKQQQSNSQHSNQTNGTDRSGGSTNDGSLEEQSEWLATKIPLPAQGIDYYA